MSSEARPVELPDALRRYFWEYDPAQLRWNGNRQFIVARLLEVGGLDAVRWLLDHMSVEELRTFLVQRRGRGIAPERLRFWELILEIPTAQVDEWIAAQQSNPWQHRTH